MKIQLASILIGSLLSTAATASDLKLLNCKGSYSDFKKGSFTSKGRVDYTVEMDIVTGGPLLGGLAEVKKSTPKSKGVTPDGHYISVSKEAPAGGSSFSVYKSTRGLKLSIPDIQTHDIAAGTYRGDLGLPETKKSISVLCRDM